MHQYFFFETTFTNFSVLKVPALALECSLQNTKPNAMLSDHEEWHPEAIQAFKELLVDFEIAACKVIAEVYSVTPGPSAPKITATVFLATTVRPTPGDSLNEQFRHFVDERNVRYAEYR